MHALLIVDDNQDVRSQLRWGLSKEGYSLHLAGDGEEAMALFREHAPGVVTLDLGLPPDPDGTSEGFRLLQEMLSEKPETQVIVITGHHDRENALKAINYGAYDFCRKPVDLSEIKVLINRGFYLHSLRSESARASLVSASHTGGEDDCMDGIIGKCSAMKDVYYAIRKVAATDVPVLVTGESGTGKELVARAIHAGGLRKSAPMVTINCGAIPENLLEAEFFGHEKGAFTGAISRVQGKVEFADKGTLFLDEIGDIPFNMQVKLLRFLQEMVFQRVGGRSDISVNTRIIAATNLDLEEAMHNGRFREDLYYRIGVVSIHLPPLREREDDVLLLADMFLEQMSHENNVAMSGFTASARKAMLHYSWPGNVRELENKVRRAVIMAGGQRISAEDLNLDERAPQPSGQASNLTLKEARNAIEKEMVDAALKRFSGNIVQAAKSIGVSRPTFYDLLKKHDISV
ncbi:PEP-CTERM-box response regulator transcription factor [Desulfovibrio mangrovi]|uniref:PEP-CTERM-box response regulator transcription factor n=1 Tax=Desulfovibrio mangrovi TaxID=2976983 RepID=UPI0022477B52|nr:PEP-CTERM-box response regulator transcription factor [Desulfovibrio mangrovi]UZP67551.1 PEP-CTERM-box response regulator transcription factor [Desulfovibrio mangrovi]